MIGIYKITSPSGKVYIGQSLDIHNRIKSYMLLQNCKNQTKLLNSLLKHGPESHTFEVIEECREHELNVRERYWQDYYDVLNKEGLNCKLTHTNSKSGKLSEYTKNKIRVSREKQVMCSRSLETKQKMSLAKKGKKLSADHIESMRKPKSEEHKNNMRGPRPSMKVPKKKIKCPKCGALGAPHIMSTYHFDNCGIKKHNKRIKCPYCNTEGNGGNMKRWHFDNCKQKDVNNFLTKPFEL